MKRFTLLIVCLLMLPLSLLAKKVSYVETDVVLRATPDERARSAGRVTAGEVVVLQKEQRPDYWIKVQAPNGSIGYVDSAVLTTPGGRELTEEEIRAGVGEGGVAGRGASRRSLRGGAQGHDGVPGRTLLERTAGRHLPAGRPPHESEVCEQRLAGHTLGRGHGLRATEIRAQVVAIRTGADIRQGLARRGRRARGHRSRPEADRIQRSALGSLRRVARRGRSRGSGLGHAVQPDHLGQEPGTDGDRLRPAAGTDIVAGNLVFPLAGHGRRRLVSGQDGGELRMDKLLHHARRDGGSGLRAV